MHSYDTIMHTHTCARTHTHTHTHTHACIYTHCKGVIGYFKVLDDVTKHCKAQVFSEIGKRTPIGVRFSTIGQLTLRCIYKCHIMLEYSIIILPHNYMYAGTHCVDVVRACITISREPHPHGGNYMCTCKLSQIENY